MLEPQNRLGYLEQLLPPEGFTLDMALGTTYSLDLLTLLIAPLSMAFFDCEDKDDALSKENAVAVLEALRRTKDRIAVFCQKGRISVPVSNSTLFSYLEPVVIEVEPEDPRGTFHPKIWILRFLGEDGRVMYRFICLSRNLTFDQSWDTALTMEGEYSKNRANAFRKNKPLSDFISWLPSLVPDKKITKKVKNIVKAMSTEVLRTDFQIPEGFNDFKFWPLGINGYGMKFGGHKRLFIMSPFLSERSLDPLLEGRDNILISRPESLDAIEPMLLRKIEKNTKILVLDSIAERQEKPEIDRNGQADTKPSITPDLHAKLYIHEEGWDAHLFTGSANATENGLSGVNVEFLTELVGKGSKVGISRILGEEECEEASFMNLLLPYDIPDKKAPIDNEAKKIEKALDEARRMITKARLGLNVEFDVGSGYSLSLYPCVKPELKDVKVYCRPITISSSHEKELRPGVDEKIIFSGLDIPLLTSFMAFRVEVAYAERKSAEFVLNLPVQGMPENRHERILSDIIRDGDRFIRYLFFLMADSPDDVLSNSYLRNAGKTTGAGNENSVVQIMPILEALVRVFSRCPERITEIDRLIEDVKKTEEGRKAMPEGFEELWPAFRASIASGGQS